MSIQILQEKIKEKNNPTVIGLDPNLDFIPEFIIKENFSKYENPEKAAAKAILAFNKKIIDEIYDIVPAVKPQCAYYEMYGVNGIKALYKTILYAKEKGLYVIADGKRNDIGATSKAYSTAFLGETNAKENTFRAFPADSLTVNPYLGTDGILPFLESLEKYKKSIFILVKTSNPSSGELQDLRLENGLTVYEQVADMCTKWGENFIGESGFSDVGAVIGATYPEQLKTLRNRMPNSFFLIPGYGVQGGKASDIALAFTKNKDGAIINNSRGILTAWQKNSELSPKEFAKASRLEALKMKNDLNSVLL